MKALINEFLINLIPSIAIPSAIGWYPGAQKASKLWASASIPVAAVNLGDKSNVSKGSKITIDGNIFGWKIIFFAPVFLLMIADALPVSDPVPAVVGTAIIFEILELSALIQ